MSATVCPLCNKPVGLGVYFSRVWFTHIECPSCRRRVKVEGTGLYYLVSAVPAVLFGLKTRAIRAEYGSQGFMIACALVLALVCGLLAVGLMTWMNLARDDAA